MTPKERRLFLGFPMDHLLDGNIDLDPKKRIGGLLMPERHSPGTGNIVICGPPGSGKSTLALQFAVASSSVIGNHAIPAFIPLENTHDEVIQKATPYGWAQKLRVFHCLKQSTTKSEKEFLNILRCNLTFHKSESLCEPDLLRIRKLFDQVTDARNPLSAIILGKMSDENRKILTSSTNISQKSANLITLLNKAISNESFHKYCPLPEKSLSDETKSLKSQLFADHHSPLTRAARQHFNRLVIQDAYPTTIAKFTETCRQATGLPCHSESALKISRGFVLLPMLSPAPIVSTADPLTLFWRRYQQLETLLKCAESLEDEMPKGTAGTAGHPMILPLVVIDSLNMFSPGIINRKELHQLFNLFRRYRRIGVFTVEDTDAAGFDSTLADVVISLKAVTDNNYTGKHLEILKSRYTDHVRGLHPYKPQGLKENCKTPPLSKRTSVGKNGITPLEHDARHGIVIFPSLHYIVVKTGNSDKEKNRLGTQLAERWGIEQLNRVLPSNLTSPSVLTIEGPRGSYKADLALSFLAKGLIEKETCLLIHLHDSPLLDKLDKSRNGWPMLSSELAAATNFTWNNLDLIEDAEQEKWQNLIDPKKATISVWRKKTGKVKPLLFEVDFKTGGLHPEEMVQVLRDIMIRREGKDAVKRVVLGDVCEIGAGYPFLRQSQTSGDMFLPAFAHIIRNHGADLIMTGSTGDLAVANEQVQRACTVSDATISTKFCDVFGQKHVILRGGGLVEKLAGDRSAPPIIRREHSGRLKQFVIDDKHLEGLVGFDTERVFRPGVAVNIFEGNQNAHRKYNLSIETTLNAGFASTLKKSRREYPDLSQKNGSSSVFEKAEVTVYPFASQESEALHDSFNVLHEGAPINRTVLCTVDEFWTRPKLAEHRFAQFPLERDFKLNELELKNPDSILGSKKGHAIVWPYYKNVLLLAYRKDNPGLAAAMGRAKDWKDIFQAAQLPQNGAPSLISKPFWCDQSAEETLACALMDALIVGYAKNPTVSPGRVTATAAIRRGDNADIGYECEQVQALHNLFMLQPRDNLPKETNSPSKESQPPPSVLAPDANIYLCWYSQLQELVREHPDLADQLDVRALPGRGFTGDWFIGIVEGSVSVQLGRTIIKMLSRKEEEYKRFSSGVGLPVRKRFYDADLDYSAWPKAQNVSLEKLITIHRQAHSRADIPDYVEFNSMLANCARQMTRFWGDKPYDTATIRQLVSRLFRQIIDQVKKPTPRPSSRIRRPAG